MVYRWFIGGLGCFGVVWGVSTDPIWLFTKENLLTTRNKLISDDEVILIQMIEKRYTVDILIHKKYCLMWTIN